MYIYIYTYIHIYIYIYIYNLMNQIEEPKQCVFILHGFQLSGSSQGMAFDFQPKVGGQDEATEANGWPLLTEWLAQIFGGKRWENPGTSQNRMV